jgi:hypothetical protein
MQGIPDNLFPDEYLPYLPQETDTATPRDPIPIYYFHDGDTPFCNNAHCFCQRGKRAGALLYRQLVTGKLKLAQLKAGTGKVSVDVRQGSPESCQLYGHDWQETEHPDMKECSLCRVRGYCPGCRPVAPSGAKPFLCTAHARRQVRL